MSQEVQGSEAAKAAAERGSRRIETGIVISDVRNKTITVEVRHLIKHARYGKYIYRSTHLHAHDENNEAKKGDQVEVMETRPLSKQKRWRLLRVVERAVELGRLDIKEVELAPAEPAAPGAESPASAGAEAPAPAPAPAEGAPEAQS